MEIRYPATPEERPRILVVEPKGFVAARLKAQLERCGHLVLGPARDGREAVTAAQMLHPNLVLMQTKLPGPDGIETARAREAGVVAYLTSVEQRRLLSTIEVALERFGELRILRKEEGDPSEALATRRVVDNAKKVLITRLGISEAEAFQRLLQRKLSTGRRLRETAWTIIEADRVLARLDFARCLQLIFQTVRQTWWLKRQTC